jgi:hypothetical protein
MLLYGAHLSVRTMYLEVEDWRSVPRGPVIEATTDVAGNVSSYRWQRAPVPRKTRLIWMRRPDCLRIESRVDDEMRQVGVIERDMWQMAEPLKRTSGSTRDESIPRFLSPAVVQPTALLYMWLFEPCGTGQIAGRSTVCARARPRNEYWAPHVRMEVELDAEHGTPLMRVVYRDGRCVSRMSAIYVRYGMELDDEVFDMIDSPALRLARGFGREE